jgi:hypothetical protein
MPPQTGGLEALNLLPAQIALLDPQGGIVFTNQVWDETAEGRLLDANGTTWKSVGPPLRGDVPKQVS